MPHHGDDLVLRDEAYRICLLCEATMPLPTAGYLRKHYRVFHLIWKEPAIDALIRSTELAAGIEPEEERQEYRHEHRK